MFGNLIHNVQKVLITSLGKKQRTITTKDKQANYSIRLLMLASLLCVGDRGENRLD